MEYRKGADIPADHLSRNPIASQTVDSTRATKAAEEYVNFNTNLATVKATTLTDSKAETLRDFKRSVLTLDRIHGTKLTSHDMLTYLSKLDTF